MATYPPVPASELAPVGSRLAPLPPKKQSARRQLAQKAIAFGLLAVVGMNDSATGANLPSMQATYNVSFDKISTVFLANTAGYATSSLTAGAIEHHFGIQRLLVLAAVALGAGCLTLSLAPPFGAFILGLVLQGYGSGLYDSSLTTVISHEEDAVMMSLMYAMFGIGAMIAPLIIGAFVDHDIPWNYYYLIPLALCVGLCVLGLFTFSTYEPPADEARPDAAEGDTVHARAKESVSSRIRRALKMRVVWLGFVLCPLAFATGDTLSAWVVTYLVEARAADNAASRYMLSGLWGGIALGRLALAYLLDKRLGEKTFVVLMLALAAASAAVVWAVDSSAVAATFVALTGFFIGPTSPKLLSALSARIPTSLKSSVMSLTIGAGLIFAAIGPLFFGFAAAAGALASLPGVIIVICFASIGGWLLMPRNDRRREE